MNTDLNEVKVGDTIIHETAFHKSLCKVKSVTPTQVVTNNGRFRKKDGFLVGRDSYCYSKVRTPREGEVKQLEEERFIMDVLHKVRQLTPNDVSYAQAVNIKQILGL